MHNFKIFDGTETLEPETLSLVQTEHLTGKLKFQDMSLCRLIYEANEPEYIEVHIAVPTRRGIVEDTEVVRGFNGRLVTA